MEKYNKKGFGNCSVTVNFFFMKSEIEAVMAEKS